jgi:hypothetical protein
MNQNLLRILLLILVPIRSASALDLTPTVSEYTAEGITFRQLNFQDGRRKAVYEPPRLWICHGGGTSLQLVPPKVDRADAIIQVVDVTATSTLDEKVVAGLKEQALRSLPPGSQTVTVLSEEQNPVSLEGKPSYGVTLSYSALGETFVRSIVFINLSEMQLSFRITARQADFEAVQRPFRSSIFSWHWVDQSTSAPGAELASSDGTLDPLVPGRPAGLRVTRLLDR